jgi:hypothetical protein
MTDHTEETLSNLLHEDRRFPPSAEFAAQANVHAAVFDAAAADRLAFWEQQAERLSWDRRWTSVLDWSDKPFARWFVGGRLNVAYNCLDRHVAAGAGDKVAYHWEGEPGDTRTITYAQLKDEVCRAANALIQLGVTTGDRVAIYMPMIPETVVAMLACARLGAPHTVVFGGFSSQALSDRIIDCDARVVITADGGYRRGAAAALKPAVDEALEHCPDVRSVLVVRRTGQEVAWTEGRDLWWHDVVDAPVDRARVRVLRRRAPALRHVHLGHHRQAQGDPAHHRRVSHAGRLHPLGGVRPQAGQRSVLVRRRYRLGDRPQLHRLRAARQRQTTPVMYEGTPNTPDRGSLVADDREVQDLDPVHRADRDPDLHEVGRGGPGPLGPLVAATAGVRRRADQPGGLGVVPTGRSGGRRARSWTPGGRPRPAPS